MKKILISALLMMSAFAQAGGGGPKDLSKSVPIVPVSSATNQTAGKAPVAGAISLATLIPSLPAGTKVVFINRGQTVIAEFTNKQVVPVGTVQDRTAVGVVTVSDGVQIRYPIAQPVVIAKPQPATYVWVLPNPQVVTTPIVISTPKPVVMTPAAPQPQTTVTPVTPPSGTAAALLTICHRTSSTTNPYTVLKVSTSQLTQSPNPEDVVYTSDGRWMVLTDWTADVALASIPVSGCPVSVVTDPATVTETTTTTPAVTTSDLLTVCHRTASATNPYTLLKVTVDQVATRTNQTDVVYTADNTWIHIGDWTPDAGIALVTLDQCPTTVISVTPTEPVTTEPALTDPVTTQPAPTDTTISVCHRTGSKTNPWTVINTTPDKIQPGDVRANADGTCPPPPAP